MKPKFLWKFSVSVALALDGNATSVAGETATPSRNWTDASGTYHVQAAFLGFKEGKVRLKKDDGQTLLVAPERLSKADKEYVAREVFIGAFKEACQEKNAELLSKVVYKWEKCPVPMRELWVKEFNDSVLSLDIAEVSVVGAEAQEATSRFPLPENARLKIVCKAKSQMVDTRHGPARKTTEQTVHISLAFVDGAYRILLPKAFIQE